MRGNKQHINGTGRLIGPGIEASVSYRIHEFQERIPTGTLDNPSASIPGLKTLSIHLEFSDPRHMPHISTDKLTLHLADGRKLALYYSGQGQFQPTGDFF